MHIIHRPAPDVKADVKSDVNVRKGGEQLGSTGLVHGFRQGWRRCLGLVLSLNRNLQLAFALNNLDEMRQHQVLDDVHPVRQDVPHNVEHGVK